MGARLSALVSDCRTASGDVMFRSKYLRIGRSCEAAEVETTAMT